MSFTDLLKRMSAAFFPQEEEPQQSEEDRFVQFYRNLLSEISSHIEYQRDMTDSVGEKSKVLKPFKVEEYAERINEFFYRLASQKSEPTVANLFFMILALPGQEQPAVSSEIRRRIFSRVAVRYADDSGRQPAELLKSLYERLKHGRGDVFGSSREELMEMLRSAATYIDVELRAAEPEPDFTMGFADPNSTAYAGPPPGQFAEASGPHAKSKGGTEAAAGADPSGGLRREQLMKLLEAAVRIKTDKDRRALLNPAAGLDFVVTGVVRLTAAFLLLFNTNQLAMFLSRISENSDQIVFFSAIIDLLGFGLVLWTLVSAVGYGRRMARKQVYKRLSARFEELG